MTAAGFARDLRVALRAVHDADRSPLWDAASMSQPGQERLFVVERRLPKISEHQLEVLQIALTGAASRFYARGDGVRYLSSIFLARTDRLLSLFAADSAETVRAVNEAALIPFSSIEPAVELPGPADPEKGQFDDQH
jgi:hypothetical protein